MALRDTTWVISDTAGAGGHFLETGNSMITRSLRNYAYAPNVDAKDSGGGIVYTTRTLRRSVVTVEREWICLTAAAAAAAVADEDSGLGTILPDLQDVETNRVLGAHKVTYRTDTYGDWTAVT